MPQDNWRSGGSTRASRPTAGNANIYSTPVLGVVKDNNDPSRSGRLRVYISDFSGMDPDDSNNWISIRYMSNFFGFVRPTAGSDSSDYGSYLRNPSSYGEWHAPPDIGTTVICIFVNGDINFGFYIGCVPESELLHMVPAVGASFADQNEQIKFNNDSEASTYGGSIRLPTTNINTNNDSITNSANYLTETKPVHSYTAAIMEQQGILRDPIRGPISSSAQRESSSRVGWGVSTPGRPIYEGGFTDEELRAKADTANPESMRIISRRGGHSFVMDDGDISGRDQLVRIRTSKGHQILMSDDGQTLMILHSNGQSYVELGKEGTIDVYSTNSINLRTQGDLNLHADNNVNIHASKNFNIHAENLQVTTKKEFKQSIGTNIKTSALGNIGMLSSGTMSLESSGVASFASTATTYINGGMINLNTGKTSSKPVAVDPLPIIAHPDTLFDSEHGFTAAPGKLQSITSRAPAHAPWAFAGKGVDVKVDLSSSSQLPTAPSNRVASIVQQGSTSGAISASIETALSSPAVKNISNQLDSTATLSLLATTAQNSATGPLKSAIEQGADVVTVGTSNVVSVGMFTQNPSQLVNAGVLKPGSDRLINSMANNGANVDQCMSPSLFTGTPGAENLTNYVRNSQVQSNAVTENLRQSEKVLVSSGIITGTESPDQVAGLVFATANHGPSVVTSINNGSPLDNTVANDIGLATNTVTSATNTIGGSGGISHAVNALNASPAIRGNIATNRGTVYSAYSAINQSFPTYSSTKPVNLLSSVDKQERTSTGVGAITDQTTATVVNDSAMIPKTSMEAHRRIGELDATNIASGMINVPGGLDSISAVSNVGIPGSGLITNAISVSSTAAFNNLPSSPISQTFNRMTVASVANASSTIASVKSLFGGKGTSRTPSIATNTTNRTEIDTKTNDLLGDAKIPSPFTLPKA